MRVETITRLTDRSQPIDMTAPGAPMRLAWFWTAQDLWSQRRFDATPDEVRALFRRHLRAAWAHVRDAIRRAEFRAKAEARSAAELRRLRQQKRDLEMRPLGMSIRDEQNRIDEQIAAIIKA